MEYKRGDYVAFIDHNGKSHIGRVTQSMPVSSAYYVRTKESLPGQDDKIEHFVREKNIKGLVSPD